MTKTKYAVIGHPKREKHNVTDKKSGISYNFYTDPTTKGNGYSAPNWDPFIWYKNWMYSFCHAHNFIDKFYDEKSKNGLKDKETYFIFVAPEDKKREKFIVDTVIKAKQIIKINKYENLDNKKTLSLITTDYKKWFIEQSYDNLTDKIHRSTNISKNDIKNIILKYHYPEAVYKENNKYVRCSSKACCSDKALYMGPVHNGKSQLEQYMVIGDPEESFIPLIRKENKFLNLTIDNTEKNTNGQTKLKSIGIISKNKKNKRFYSKDDITEDKLKEILGFTFDDLLNEKRVPNGILYKKTSSEFVEDVFDDKDYFDKFKKFNDEDYWDKIKATKL